MQRENKFRGKHIHIVPGNEHLDGRWIYGYLSDKDYINSPELEGEFLVDENTVGQYTGLKDKNGKEIYEGDILEEGEGYYFEVVWEGQWAKFKLQWKNKAYQYPEWNRGINMQVIGNIYDNPELLQEVERE